MSLKIISHGGVNSLVNEKGIIVLNNNKDVDVNKIENALRYTHDEIKEAVDKLNKALEKEKSHAEISVYKKLKALTIKIINDETNEVIMEVPPEKILDLVAKMCELNGVIVDKDV